MPQYPLAGVPVSLFPTPRPKDTISAPRTAPPPPPQEVRELLSVHRPDRRPAAWSVVSVSDCLLTVHFGSKPIKGGASVPAIVSWTFSVAPPVEPPSALLSPEPGIPKSRGPWPEAAGLFLLCHPAPDCLCLVPVSQACLAALAQLGAAKAQGSTR